MAAANTAIDMQTRCFDPSEQPIDGPHDNAPDVPAADELFCDEAMERLRYSGELEELVGRLRIRERDVAERARLAGRDELIRSYGEIVAAELSMVGLVLPGAAYCSTASLFEAVASLPFTPRSSSVRRKAREIARIAMLSDEGRLRVPACVDDLHTLWEQAMLREPRWSVDFPSSDFRTGNVTVRGSKPEYRVVHRCMPADEMPFWLNRLIDLLSDERLAPELRAACGLGLQDWIHPFSDGNGHVGRLIMLSVLEGGYSQPTLVCLAREFVVNRNTTVGQFARLRNREHDAVGFCAGLLGQVSDAQEYVLDVLG
jgi:hypothetical protein